MSVNDTIAAIATAPGRGGVGIVRLSGPQALTIAHQCVHLIDENTKKRTCAFSPRHAYFSRLIDEHNHVIDEGITLYFPNPHSFTGEDVVEFQGHGGPVVLDMVLHRMTSLGARIANPGEFSERAFLNDKIDLTQAEAIADLINANSKHAAVQATRSLRGAFAKEIDTLLEKLTQLRIFVESAIDFPEEEIDFLNDGVVDKKLSDLIEQVLTVTHKAQQGSVIREGMKVVLAGLPNSGKSTLLNTLTERDAAIVTDIEGTTRDTLTEHIHINGMPLHITDTAGLRETDDEVEKIGVARAWEAIAEADRVLLLLDGTALHKSDIQRDWAVFCETDALRAKLTIVINKTDALQTPLDPALTSAFGNPPSFLISALKNTGIDPLKNHLLEVMGLGTTQEGHFSARRRHLDALARGHAHLSKGQEQLRHYAAGELLAEDLRQAHNALGEITGKLSADDLLGEIFSSFCIGK